MDILPNSIWDRIELSDQLNHPEIIKKQTKDHRWGFDTRLFENELRRYQDQGNLLIAEIRGELWVDLFVIFINNYY